MTYVLDQIENYPTVAFSGSYSDHTFYGKITKQDDVGFSREAIVNKSDPQTTIKLLQKNFLYSERLRYYTGTLATGSIRINQSKIGARTQNLFAQSFSNEKYFDSFVPLPTDIAKATNADLAFVPQGAGTLDAAPNFGLPSTDQEVPIIFGNEQLFTSSNIVNTDWTSSPFPFQKKYQGLQRIFNSTFTLPEQEELSVNFATGEVITPVSRSNIVGSVYYTENTPVKANTSTIFNYVTEDQNISNQLAVNGTVVGPFSASHAIAYKPLPSFSTERVARAAIDEGGGFYYTTTNTQATSGKTTTISKTYENPNFIFKCISASVTAQRVSLSNWTSTCRWFAGGRHRLSNRAIVSRFSSAGTFVDYYDVISSGSKEGIVYGLANAKVVIAPGANQRNSGRMVAVGQRDSDGNGFISTSTNHSGSFWIPLAFNTAGNALRAVVFDRYTDKFWAVGDGGYVYSSSNTDGTIWTGVAAISGVFPIDYNCIATNDKGTIVLAGKRTDGTPEKSIVQLFFPTRTTMNAPLNQRADGLWSGSFHAVSYVPQNNEFVLVGQDGMMQRSGSDTSNFWSEISNTTQFRGTFYGASDGYGWTLAPVYNSINAYPLFVGEEFTYTKDALVFRTTDLINDRYTNTAYGSVNNLALMPTGAVGLSAGSQFTRSTIEDGLKSFYGFGKGFSITFDGSILTEPTGTFSILPRRGIAYRDFKIIQSGLSIETVRLIGPRVQGFSYGVMNVTPQSSKVIWRRGKYGQFRDMLEQRPNAKYYLPPVGNDATRYSSVVKVYFVSGSNDAMLSSIYMNATSSVDFNRYDSGIYDLEYRSGQPFFDQRDV